ncbi:thrombospondin type 3 repeat-containing protein [Desulfuromonas versatilis]|uniref:thrombospondin type 3 repeat-containing protein n=1 Tax=Desulfuromonas versatilis TaxID=2802975 RepID=UPI001CED11C8|nr:thrombospondin type 3 repeat-containing protein [Desulfuromonas versatilis]
MFLSDIYPSGTVFGGAKVGYWIDGKDPRDKLGLELAALSAQNPDLFMLRADALYPFYEKSAWRLFVSVGLGGFSVESDFDPVAAAGLVAFYQPNRPLALRMDARPVRGLGQEEHNGWELGLSLHYDFGYKHKPVPKPPADADGDGVPDARDRCPDTPLQFEVDRFGCPINPPDGDKDKVPDYLDKCPGTEAGMEVGPDGCAPDSDQDGVPDYRDKCPNNPPGLRVDANGCVKTY